MQKNNNQNNQNFGCMINPFQKNQNQGNNIFKESDKNDINFGEINNNNKNLSGSNAPHYNDYSVDF